MKFILNIGLKKGRSSELLPLINVVRVLRDYGLELGSKKVAQSETEPTLIIEVEYPFQGIFDALESIASKLEQEAIAFYSPNLGKGWLVGEKAKEWGDFNPDYFLTLDGKPLSSK